MSKKYAILMFIFGLTVGMLGVILFERFCLLGMLINMSDGITELISSFM